MRYVWLNIETGKFSDSWTEEEHKKYFNKKTLAEHFKEYPHWKLIRFECVNDKIFYFNDNMKLR